MSEQPSDNTPNDPQAALQTLMQATQNLAQGWLRLMAQQMQQASAQQSTPSASPFTLPKLPPLPESWQDDSGQMKSLGQQWLTKQTQLWQAMLAQGKEGAPPLPQINLEPGDKRFSGRAWSASPLYDYLRQSYLINAEFMRQAVELAPVSDGQAKNRLRFTARQIIDAAAPSNFAASNPEFIETALATEGKSITQGIQNMLADLEKGRISMTDDAAFEVGKNLATTPGAVVYENDLMQLIQYSPLTDTVAKRPFVMVPPCINKFYILDLQAENSFVRYAVEQGHTVFLVSWRNVDASLGHKTWDDYIEEGPLTAFRVVKEICQVEQVNALGFCVGGTIISSALSVMKARGGDDVASLTLLTTLLDFSDPGELGCFIDEASQVARENSIGRGGILRGQELANVFSALRANDLIWQYVVGNYLKGGKPMAFDLLYWNSDSTNLPGPFLAWYLRNMYLENSLRIPGKLAMCGVKADLTRLDFPLFILATREDHIVPWKSSYLGRALVSGETTFVLGASGHIAGVINPAAKNKRSYWVNEQKTTNPDEWLDSATEVKGSWWPYWSQWLHGFADGAVPARGKLGNKQYKPIEAAPGRYVKEKA